jgi:ABC-type multidrug transport system fused ATPase/permease subunit
MSIFEKFKVSKSHKYNLSLVDKENWILTGNKSINESQSTLITDRTSSTLDYTTQQKIISITLSWKSIKIKVPRDLIYTFKNACIKTNVNETKKYILNDINGIVKSGELMCLMGASGSGKTSLLNALNFRSQNSLDISGEIKLNGHKASPKLMNLLSCYIQQDHLFFGTLTVKEHLIFHVVIFSFACTIENFSFIKSDSLKNYFSL